MLAEFNRITEKFLKKKAPDFSPAGSPSTIEVRNSGRSRDFGIFPHKHIVRILPWNSELDGPDVIPVSEKSEHAQFKDRIGCKQCEYEVISSHVSNL